MNAEEIGNKILQLRKGPNLSQAQLADKLFISAQAVGKWERGESIPDIVTLNRLATIMDVDLNYFSDKFQSTSVEGINPTEIESGSSPQEFSWDMSRGKWEDGDFSGLKNLAGKFNSSDMMGCNFSNSDLSKLVLDSNRIEHCNFTKSEMSNVHMTQTLVSNSNFTNCDLGESKFSKSTLKQSDFSKANWAGVIIEHSTFKKNKVIGALWKRTTFVDTHIYECEFVGEIDNCSFERTAFENVVFKDAILLNTFFKVKGRKLKGVRFDNSHADRITYEFLKNAKADLNGLTKLED